MKILIVTTESFEFITTKIIEDVLGRLIRRGRTHWKSLELRIKVFCFTGIRLEQKNKNVIECPRYKSGILETLIQGYIKSL